MPEKRPRILSVQRVENSALVVLKVERRFEAEVRQLIDLAKPQHIHDGEPMSLWYGPDCWILVSETQSADAMSRFCTNRLQCIPHNAVDFSSALATIRIGGEAVREVLATGSGADFRPSKFKDGCCVRTRLAQVPAIVVAIGDGLVDIYVERSYERYMLEWLEYAARISGFVGNTRQAE